jgi:phosphatidylserine decarboxylase
LFSRNERVVVSFDNELGPMALVLVGAMIVAGIETTWAGRITPFDRKVRSISYPVQGESQQPLVIEKGDEMGRFFLGSTIVMCFGKGKMHWLEEMKAEQPLRLGETMGLTLE